MTASIRPPDSAGANRSTIPRSVRGDVQTYGQGRTCAEPVCSTALSRYNKEALCWRHAEQREVMRRQQMA